MVQGWGVTVTTWQGWGSLAVQPLRVPLFVPQVLAGAVHAPLQIMLPVQIGKGVGVGVAVAGGGGGGLVGVLCMLQVVASVSQIHGPYPPPFQYL